MLDGIRNSLARGFDVLAQRVSTEPRHINQGRVPYSPRTVAGVAITPDTALKSSAYWAATRWLSQSVAAPPWHVFRKVDAGADLQSSNTVDWLLYKRPNPEWSSFQFRETLTHWALRWGNGWAEIERDTLGRAIALWPIHPDRAELCRDKETGELYLEVSNGASGKVEIPYADVFHIRGFGEGVVGANVIHFAAQSLGWAQAAQVFGAAFFGNGAAPAVVVRNKKGLSPEGLMKQKAEFDALYKGPTRAHKTAHVDNDAEIESIGFNAKDSQLIEVHQHLVEEICRWVGVPPHKVMHLLRATFSNIEHQAIEAVVDSIAPWAKRFEDEADFKLFGQNRRSLYTKINLNALLRGDMKARMEFYRGMIHTGAYSPNRILELEDENTIGAAGDIHVMQEQMVPLEYIAKRIDPAAEKAAPRVQPNQADDDDDDGAARAMFESIMSHEPIDA